jgi:hypothetical protein
MMIIDIHFRSRHPKTRSDIFQCLGRSFGYAIFWVISLPGKINAKEPIEAIGDY